jgi:MFS family permease
MRQSRSDSWTVEGGWLAMKGDGEEQAALAPRDRWLVLAGLFAGVFIFGISFAAVIPWMALILEARGTDPTVIGIVAAAGPIGVMAMAPFVGRIMQRLGTANAIIAGTLVSALTLFLMPLFDSIVGWIVLRFISGLGGAVPWVATETWINVVAGATSRGRVVGLYGALLSAGFAVGPLVLSVVGVEGWVPAVVFGVLCALALAPVVAIRRHSPRLETEEHFPAAKIIAAMPVVYAAAFLAGLVDTAFFTFLPIWGLRMHLDPAFALALLSVFVAGNIALQLPVGLLADRIGTRPVMALCGLISVISPIGAVYAAGIPILLCAILFVWGGAIWALYTLAMIDIGHRCRGTTLAAASGALVVVYTISNITGPPLTGAAMQAWDPHGLMVVSTAIAAIFLLIMAIRQSE